MNPHVLHTRLVALAIGVVVAVCAIAAVWLAYPAQAFNDSGREYGYVYSGTKSSSVPFIQSNLSEDSLIVFGSSEFSTPSRIVPQVPGQVFGKTNYGLRLMLVGEAYDQSLWHAIALGAFDAAGAAGGKVAIIATPGWFVDGGQDSDTFSTRFSYSLYDGFCSNADVPDEAKRHVRERLESLGIDETALNAASPTLPQDHLNRLVLGALDDFKLRQGLVDVRKKGTDLVVGGSTPETPDFGALRKEALDVAKSMSTTNDWGLEDAFYTDKLEPVLGDLEGSRADETYSDTPEYDDFDCFLDIADACGIEVLVVLAPELGPYYDLLGIPASARANCYDRIRSIVAAHPSAKLADFSDREYEKYFLYDIVHFGWTGWVDVEEALYRFAREDS